MSNASKFTYLLHLNQISKQLRTTNFVTNPFHNIKTFEIINKLNLIQMNKDFNNQILNLGIVDKKILTVIIIYQHPLNFTVLILEKSSQDYYLKGYLGGKENTLFSSRSNLLIINVSVLINSTSQSKKDFLNQRRWHAKNLSNCHRPVHQTQIQGNYEWRSKLIYDK
ncbi:unannotated protein [freshwater metagenome]|uniref:Unannotated protein n=1 Tax=freshwater metagenome TaxID=449393 RepID=A0A6J6ZN20_9ZZZZ